MTKDNKANKIKNLKKNGWNLFYQKKPRIAYFSGDSCTSEPFLVLCVDDITDIDEVSFTDLSIATLFSINAKYSLSTVSAVCLIEEDGSEDVLEGLINGKWMWKEIII